MSAPVGGTYALVQDAGYPATPQLAIDGVLRPGALVIVELADATNDQCDISFDGVNTVWTLDADSPKLKLENVTVYRIFLRTSSVGGASVHALLAQQRR